MHKVQIPQGVHIVAKPIGSSCNLKCNYCFYLEKSEILEKNNSVMSREILEKYIKNYMMSQTTPEVEFVWHGGEPLLAGLDFFKTVVEIQKEYSEYKKITNSIQTNGTLLTAEWCEFFCANNFIVGLSLDGPKEIHDMYRVGEDGKGSFDAVYSGLKLLQKYEIEYNVLACVTRESCKQGKEIYDFFKNEGIKYIQFTPLVEKIPNKTQIEQGYKLGVPQGIDKTKNKEKWINLTEWSVIPKEYGEFLVAIYEKWVREDVGKIFVMNFEAALTQWFGNPSPSCVHARQCGRSLALESDGTVYTCDHFVYPEYNIGNIEKEPLSNMVESSIKKGFGREKEEKLTEKCKKCLAINFCWGGCPKHRFVKIESEKYAHNYLCEGYEIYFRHIQKYLKVMGELLTNGYPADYVMEAIKGPLILPKVKKK